LKVQQSWLCQRTLEKVFARCIFTEANRSSAYWKGECNRFSDGKQSRTYAFIGNKGRMQPKEREYKQGYAQQMFHYGLDPRHKEPD
ncbi:hypothetical protein KUCAC02_016920, partial [Chaenocephalus aceratus]